MPNYHSGRQTNLLFLMMRLIVQPLRFPARQPALIALCDGIYCGLGPSIIGVFERCACFLRNRLDHTCGFIVGNGAGLATKSPVF